MHHALCIIMHHSPCICHNISQQDLRRHDIWVIAKICAAGENPDIGAIRVSHSQTATTFMPLWIYDIHVCKHSDMNKHFENMSP